MSSMTGPHQAAPDARIPVVFGSLAERRPGDAVLLESDWAAPAPAAAPKQAAAHAPGCACCRPRSGMARALTALFLARARGTGTGFGQDWFERVLVVGGEPARHAMRLALEADEVAGARFSLAVEAAPDPPRHPGHPPARAGAA